MIELKGITANSPISFMAALGLLRVLNQDQGIPAKLGWQGGHACLTGLDTEDELVELLVQHMKDRVAAPEWNLWPSTRKISQEDYAECVNSLSQNTRATQFLCAFATDLVVRDDGSCANTRLDLTSGQQGLLKELRKVAIDLQNPNIAKSSIRSSLLGGPYEAQASLGWDPVTVRRHAHESKAPTDQKGNPPPGKKGLVWFAAESFPLHPLLSNNGKAQTPGCERYNSASIYFWPLWQGMIGIDSACSLRLLNKTMASSLMGVTDTWASVFGKSGNYGALLPAKRLS